MKMASGDKEELRTLAPAGSDSATLSLQEWEHCLHRMPLRVLVHEPAQHGVLKKYYSYRVRVLDEAPATNGGGGGAPLHGQKEPVRRRYSSFVALQAMLRARYPGMLLPSLPGKGSQGSAVNRARRAVGLNLFCETLVRVPYLRCDPLVALFLLDPCEPDKCERKLRQVESEASAAAAVARRQATGASDVSVSTNCSAGGPVCDGVARWAAAIDQCMARGQGGVGAGATRAADEVRADVQRARTALCTALECARTAQGLAATYGKAFGALGSAVDEWRKVEHDQVDMLHDTTGSPYSASSNPRANADVLKGGARALRVAADVAAQEAVHADLLLCEMLRYQLAQMDALLELIGSCETMEAQLAMSQAQPRAPTPASSEACADAHLPQSQRGGSAEELPLKERAERMKVAVLALEWARASEDRARVLRLVLGRCGASGCVSGDRHHRVALDFLQNDMRLPPEAVRKATTETLQSLDCPPLPHLGMPAPALQGNHPGSSLDTGHG